MTANGTPSAAAAATTGGIHHVTMFSGDPRRIHAFYAGTLGLRLVKRTVNFDDPATHHLYYGDAAGSPGTILTFFPVPGLPPGRHGTGQVGEVALAVPRASFAYWLDRLATRGVEATRESAPRFGEPLVALRDPDGLRLALVGLDDPGPPPPAWEGAPVPPEHAIRGVRSVALWLDDAAPTAEVLTRALGFREAATEGEHARYVAGGDGGSAVGAAVDLRRVGGFWRGAGGAGTVHHVAFRAADDAAQAQARRALASVGLDPTPVLDRQYFRSIYAREPGGVLFEVATDPPGFATDEPPEALGAALRLPPWLEPRREAIARALPPLAGNADAPP